MNVNVVVLKVLHDVRGRPIPKTSTEALSGSVEEVLELAPHNGIWGSNAPEKRNAGIPRARFAEGSPSSTRYDQKGRVHYSSETKGLRINIIA